MNQLHPALSGLPGAFIALLAVVEGACFFRGTQCPRPLRSVIVCAVLAATVAAFLSGYQASSALGDLPADVSSELGFHHAVGRFLLIGAFLLAVFAWLAAVARRRQALFRLLYLSALAAQVSVNIWVGLLGGRLVFERGVGVSVQAVRALPQP